ncbi:MAG: hypothetical protein H6838_05855 [Planctomycetes bacterium]|nr:hypothetical protein [Planctomycetota bacterium]MCB9884995.1 hypothetical protein [Planctomycetota bacterium]
MTDPNATPSPAAVTTGAKAVRDDVSRRLQTLLGDQTARLRNRFFWHGLCTTALLVLGAILLFFLLDHSLRLPQPIRLLHTFATAALLVGGLLRFVRYPMTRPLQHLDVAEVIERSFPTLHQRLVSAIQLQPLQGEALRGQSRSMVDELLADTQAAIATLPLHELFDSTRTRQLGLGAAGIAVLLTAGALLGPQTARAFVLRHLGMNADYPRDTYLVVELPPASPELQREDRDGETLLLLSAGADLHVSVLATGVVPKEAFLDVSPLQQDEDRGEPAPARSVPMTPRPGDRFRYVFRRLSGSFEFHARGGDDEHGDRRVVVRTIHPPQVATITANVTPPSYTGSEVLVQQGGAIEALTGSEVELAVTTTAAVRSATLSFLESGRRVELEPTAIQDDSGVGTAYRGKFTIEKSDRYEVELRAENGLQNPNPGNYPVSALQDYAPVGRWLLPDEENLLLLPGALLCLRLELRDDFGLQGVDLNVEHGGSTALTTSLLQAPQAGEEPVKQQVATRFFEVRDLLGGGEPAGAGQGNQRAPSSNDGLSLQVVLTDICAPAANTTELPRRIVQIVDDQQLAAAIAKMFRGLREETEQALEIQRDRRTRLEDLLGPEGTSVAAINQVLTGIEVGQARVASSATRLHNGLMRAFDMHLWNRLETSPNAPRVIDVYQRFSRDLQQPLALDPAFYREIARLRGAGTLGALETTLDPILAMVVLADGLATTRCPATMRTLAQAEVSRDTERRQLLADALADQRQIQTDLEQLLLRLEEWNDFQDLIQETRALRDRQRDLQTRTEEVKGK